MPTINQTSVRWALALAAFIALFAGVVAGAQAATGGASTVTPSAETEVEGEHTFGAWRYGGASWYGPGLWGRKTACGQTLQPGTMGVAHKKLPCGTTVKFVYHGREVVTQVIDRGPYVDGRAWDLTKAVSDALGFEGVGRVRYAVAIGDATSARSD
ncbi:MAG TPA: septal ring lytic transglycosylase RlpA family protein [Solirubrobacterales bacterium]|jgi:rare lipoprotein A (peptidoglycan hydrolase)|nr:septal ring lytic transglycosylase RlpA family protein [Solirubrobacterales bacterium]